MRYTDYNGYLVAGTLKSDNAGFSKWGIAQKDGQDYFLKEFLSPVYPQNASMYSPEQAEKRRKYCEKYEAQKTLLYKTINEASDGNDVRIVDFFRCESHYYIAMPCIPSEKLTPEDVAQMSSAGQAQQRLLCKTLAHSIWKLHKVGIVHGDLKWDNVLLQKSQSGGLTTKIIDFDNSFLKLNPLRTRKASTSTWSIWHRKAICLRPERTSRWASLWMCSRWACCSTRSSRAACRGSSAGPNITTCSKGS